MGVRRAFFPLDHQLHLRPDQLSEGSARVGLRLSLGAASFESAAADFEDAVGFATSTTSLWRLTQTCGKTLESERKQEAEQAIAPAQKGESPTHRRLAPVDSLVGKPANISTDGGMIHIREEGWKEVKLSAISTFDWHWDPARERDVILLSQHSYTATLDTADDFAAYQYAEGLRRDLHHVRQLSSVNDGAGWIGRITKMNFPNAVQILDWYHAKSRLILVAQALWPSSERQQNRWLGRQLTRMRSGHTQKIIQTLESLAKQFDSDIIPTAIGYFRDNLERMNYQRFRRLRLPIGSGTVESAVQQVIQHRMHRPGRGWKRTSATRMLHLLCEYHSNRFSRTWHRLFT